ncbi:hypothetical protein SAMN04490248_12040 [Salinihabitans flavidus]|uniref:Uncharacterized protein n=1 Tax=Salinihabitans flavidus TaxID=569882 RepID=A0A1H8UIA1_9RHOB|nr:hypothetical protein [Salinihabitans flavidus]SEP02960.1 hypothetical protein SAMN04490248_12040 [Salinihabitans flavidus]
MARDMSAMIAAALDESALRPILFFEGEFASGWVRIWSGLGDITWTGQTWTGVGSLLGLGAIEETQQVVAGGTTVSLSGVPLEMVALAIDEARQGKPGRVWLGLLTDAREIIADPVQAFTGRLDVPEIADTGESCTVTISYENRLIDLGAPRNWRYTHESQQALAPGDQGFAFVTTIQDKEITWGRG